MARALYGATLGDYDIDSNGRPTPHSTFDVWSALVDGAHITDLLDYAGSPTTVAVADDSGFVRLWGPDGYTDDLFGEDINGNRYVLRPVDTTSRLVAAESTIADTAVTVVALAGVVGDGSNLARQDKANLALAAAPETRAVGAVTVNGFGAVTAATLAWPDGATGTFTADTTSGGAVNSYHLTHVLGGVTTTYTQPAVTRDGNGAIVNRPALVVS